MHWKLRLCAAAAALVLAAAPALGQPAAPDVSAADPLAEAPAPATEEEIAAFIETFEASLEHRKGVVPIAGAHVTLNVPNGFYFLDASDANDVLVDVWGNPPDSTVNGMLFPEGMSPFDDDSWGVVLTYEDTGYVSDADATSIDYDMLIDAMRQSAEEENPTRVRMGYPKIDIIGWAAQPRYDATAHKLYWAKELEFDDSPDHTLNYDMRVLGRYGVLSLNFVAGLEQLADIERASPAVLQIPAFDDGFRYQDFNPGTDAKADFGIAGLIGGAAAATALAKNGGIIGAILLFLKKGWVLIFAAIGGIGALYQAVFNRKGKAKAKAEQRASTAFFDGSAEPETPAPSDPPPPPGASGT